MNIDDLNPFQTKTANGISHQQFLFKGENGNLECLLSVPVSQSPLKKMAVICHPHPLYAGTMHNKVVSTVAKILNKNGLPVMRFNFRGIEKSDGEYANGIGEKEDLTAVANLMKALFPAYSLWLAGFSFGSYIAASMQRTLQAEQLITIAPAVTSFDFNHFPPPTCRWLLIQGLADEVIDANAVLTWAQSLESPPIIKTLPDTSHFFHRKLIPLGRLLEEELFNHYA